jgi:hypothetical protein
LRVRDPRQRRRLILSDEAYWRPENREEILVAKNLPENGLQKPSKPADSLHTNQPSRNPEFSASSLSPIVTRISALFVTRISALSVE